jgi:cell division transport system permease protein
MTQPAEKNKPRSRPNYFYAIISVALVLFLLGFFGLIILQAQQLVTVFKERVNLLVELEASTPEEAIDELKMQLRQSRFLKPGSVQFISQEEAADIMREDFGEDFLKLDLPNPFYDVITFNVMARYMESDSLAAIRSEIRANPYVNDVYYQESLVDDIARNVRRIAYIALGVGLFFIIIAVTLIHNTIRLALYANRFLVKNMELVGASWKFISRPYLWRAAAHGLLSGLMAVTALFLLLYWVQRDLPEIQTLEQPLALGLLFGVLVLLGVLINTLSTYYVVNKYLKMRVDDLY